jgi:hypothetical protein
MRKLSDFKDEKGIQIAAEVLAIIMDILANKKNAEQAGAKTPLAMFSAFMKNSPKEMKKIFAILSEKEEAEYTCDGAEAMTNMLILANDSILVNLFISQGRTGDAKSSGSASENTEE